MGCSEGKAGVGGEVGEKKGVVGVVGDRWMFSLLIGVVVWASQGFSLIVDA